VLTSFCRRIRTPTI
jgi:hypothetical protein